MVNSPTNTVHRTLRIVLGAGMLVGLASCGSGGRGVTPKEEVNTGLMALGSGDVETALISAVPTEDRPPSKEDLVNQAAMDLERILAEGPRRKTRSQPPAADSAAAPVSEGTASTGLSSLEPAVAAKDEPVQDPFVLAQADEAWAKEAQARTPAVPEAGAGSLQGADATSVSHAPPVSQAEDRLVALAARLASLIRERKQDGTPQMSEAVALATLEAFEPGSLKSLDAPGSPLNTRLSAEDRDALVAARERVAQSPAASSDQIREAIAKIAAPTELKIGAAKLCRRVMGFGRYDAFGSNAFPAGRLSKAIVYTEIDGFGARPARTGDPATSGTPISEQVSVELEQSLTLFQDKDGYQVWHRPAQRVIETSNAKRRDFYLIQIIEFNQALSIGKYNLKVTLRDVTTGAVTETVVPLEIVGP